MIYTANITTPANTAQTALKKTTIQVTKGLVFKVEFYFPAGSSGLMGVAVFDGLYQVWPSSVGNFFVSDDETIRFDDMYLKESEPFTFQVYTYNVDDTYEHYLAVRIGLVSAELFIARFMPTKGRHQLGLMRQKIVTERDVRAKEQRAKLKETAFAFLSDTAKAEADVHRVEIARHQKWLDALGLE